MVEPLSKLRAALIYSGVAPLALLAGFAAVCIVLIWGAGWCVYWLNEFWLWLPMPEGGFPP